MAAYDKNMNILATYSFGPGSSTGNADNTAIFAGIMDSDMGIRTILIGTNVDFLPYQSFVFNQLDFLICPDNLNPVPVPGALLLLGSGPLALFGRRRKA